MTKLSDAHNIGKVLELKLNKVGINSLEDLKKLGTEKAFSKIKSLDKNAGRSTLFSIDGAIEGIKWHQLDGDRKDNLRSFFNELEQQN